MTVPYCCLDGCTCNSCLRLSYKVQSCTGSNRDFLQQGTHMHRTKLHFNVDSYTTPTRLWALLYLFILSKGPTMAIRKPTFLKRRSKGPYTRLYTRISKPFSIHQTAPMFRALYLTRWSNMRMMSCLFQHTYLV